MRRERQWRMWVTFLIQILQYEPTHIRLDYLRQWILGEGAAARLFGSNGVRALTPVGSATSTLLAHRRNHIFIRVKSFTFRLLFRSRRSPRSPAKGHILRKLDLVFIAEEAQSFLIECQFIKHTEIFIGFSQANAVRLTKVLLRILLIQTHVREMVQKANRGRNARLFLLRKRLLEVTRLYARLVG